MMSNYPLVSVVVPFYNIELYAKRCIESLLSQTYERYELVLIDDGSTDGTAEILDLYATDSRVRVLHFENGGLSAARNRGVAVARGDYVSFVDGDDFVSPYYLEYLVGGIAEEPDVLVVSIEKVTPHSGNVSWDAGEPSYTRFASKCAMGELAYDRIKTAAWGKLAPRKLYENVSFPEGRLYEEISTAGSCILGVREVSVLDRPVYAYVMHGGSIVNRSNARFAQVLDYDAAISLICNAIEESGCEGAAKAVIYQRTLQHLRMMPLLKRVSDDMGAADTRWKTLLGEIRRDVFPILEDNQVSKVAKARVCLAAMCPNLYLRLIEARDRNRTRR